MLGTVLVGAFCGADGPRAPPLVECLIAVRRDLSGPLGARAAR